MFSSICYADTVCIGTTYLPEQITGGYTQLEYIESTGTQFINTGITDKNRVGNARFYEFSLISNNSKILHLVPARCNSDGAIGMYDTENHNFCTNAATSGDDFVAGPNINIQKCQDVGSGYWASATVMNYGQTSTRNPCPAGTTTQGYGADEVSDCGHELHFGDYFVYTKSSKPSVPSINLNMCSNNVHHIDLSSTNHELSKLHIMYNGKQYTAYDDGLLNGERNPLTGDKVQ